MKSSILDHHRFLLTCFLVLYCSLCITDVSVSLSHSLETECSMIILSIVTVAEGPLFNTKIVGIYHKFKRLVQLP